MSYTRLHQARFGFQRTIVECQSPTILPSKIDSITQSPNDPMTHSPHTPTPKPDFTRRRSFPGTHGNPFDRLLEASERLERLPAPLFAALLLVLAGLPTAFSLSPSLSFL